MPSTESPACVLVIEDDEHISGLLTFLLERQGYRVEACRDGRAARTVIETGEMVPALILLDVMLPFVDGFQLVTLLRDQLAWAQVPVIMLTAKSQERDIVRALDAGASDYIVKPFQPNELVARVRRLARTSP